MMDRSTTVLNSLVPRVMTRGAMAVLCAVMLARACLLHAGTGTVDTDSGWYIAGTNIAAKATPELYSKFDGWGGDPQVAGLVTQQVTIAVTNAMNITATFSDKLTSTNSVPHRWLNAVLGITSDFETAVTNDHDEDGFTTGQEYWSGTDPNTNASYLHISEVYVQDGEVKLKWEHAKIDGVIPDIYIQGSLTALTGSWENVATNQPTNGVNSWAGVLQQRGFYRLSVTNMP